MSAAPNSEPARPGAAELGLLPPADLAVCFGGGDYVAIGRRLLERLVERCGLLPDERVLDVGCGAGRAAVPLTGYLSAAGRYEGFDTYPFGVQWCREHLTPAFPNFRFRVADVYNALYNPFAAVRARDYRFPFPDGGFDLAILNSVFTHMLPEDMVGYCGQLARVLDAGGRVYATWFLLDDATRALLRAGRGRMRFGSRYGVCFLENPDDPEEAVGYERSFALRALERAGLRVREVLEGDWSGRSAAHYQDVIVAEKVS